MKKLGILALVIGFLVVGTINVKALTQDDLKDKLLQTIEVGGEKYSLSSGDKKIVKDYFAAHTLTSDEITLINGKIDRAIQLTKEQGNVDYRNYPQSVKDELKTMVKDIAEHTSVNATLTRDGLTVDGKLITKLVKQTGYETSKTAIIAGISFIIVAVGTCLVIKQVKTSE